MVRSIGPAGQSAIWTAWASNDRASSVVVERGEWQVCDDSRFNGRCVVLRAGSYPSLRSLGLNDRVSSLRPASYGGDWARPEPAPIYEYRRRPNERPVRGQVTDVRAICSAPSAPLLGGTRSGFRVRRQRRRRHFAIIGGILGHQIGGGRGQDIATTGGARSRRSHRIGRRQFVRSRLSTLRDLSGRAPAYWDVTYRFRGVEHHANGVAPGSTITVNGNGVPRG